ncbi:hypothetical protein FB471_5556 [Amycolatopsis cihanbeyliensis]|uniref:Uncharacterized protein n=2 Tax=Amycolatopsis cihanbeyliensis TaxID=1128664 RepID=A0A542DRI4_AMYCI|nr:hypothetical protein FB471_5556 [Amycolatopsis cihanbeyliensis]
MLRPRWARARSYLVAGLVVCPLMFVLTCLSMMSIAVAGRGVSWWLVLPVVGAALPAAIVLGSLRSLLYEPPRWGRAAFLTGGCQLLLGGIPGVGMAMNAGTALATTGASAVFLLQLALLVLGFVFAHRANRVLLSPPCPELGATPFTVAFRARIADLGLMSGSAVVAEDRVEWSARRHKGRGGPTAHGSLTFARLRGARPTVLPDTGRWIPWLRLSDGSTVHASPGPAVLLASDTGEWMLPVTDAEQFVQLLHWRVNRRT